MTEQTQLLPHRGGLILTFGILGLVVCFILGIVAWVMGAGDLKAMAEGRMDPGGRDLTNAGKICGMVSVILAASGLAIGVLMLALGLLASSH